MLETAQECVKAMNNEVVGLRVRLARTSQEAKEKLQLYIFFGIQVLTQIERSSHDTRDLNPYGEEMDGRSCK